MTSHVFVDETKHGGYLLAAGVVVPPDLDPIRQQLRSLVLPGQRRIHMNAESNSRRRAIVAAVVQAGVSATVYDAGRRHHTEKAARAACLRALVVDAARERYAMLVIEEDQTLI